MIYSDSENKEKHHKNCCIKEATCICKQLQRLKKIFKKEGHWEIQEHLEHLYIKPGSFIKKYDMEKEK